MVARWSNKNDKYDKHKCNKSDRKIIYQYFPCTISFPGGTCSRRWWLGPTHLRRKQVDPDLPCRRRLPGRPGPGSRPGKVCTARVTSLEEQMKYSFRYSIFVNTHSHALKILQHKPSTYEYLHNVPWLQQFSCKTDKMFPFC